MKNLSTLEKNLNLKFKNKDLFQKALIHRSYLNEHPTFKLGHNERLEFLGDAVLELIITKFLFQNFEQGEGQLTRFRSSLVNTKTLAQVAKKIKLNNYLFLSKGESNSKGRAREVILANTFESLLGAIYLDQGFGQAEKFVHHYLIPILDDILKNKLYRDSKSKFQELVQNKLKITPVYKLIQESGLDHAKKFTIGVFLNQKLIAKGMGKNKHEAETEAAKKALKKKLNI